MCRSLKSYIEYDDPYKEQLEKLMYEKERLIQSAIAPHIHDRYFAVPHNVSASDTDCFARWLGWSRGLPLSFTVEGSTAHLNCQTSREVDNLLEYGGMLQASSIHEIKFSVKDVFKCVAYVPKDAATIE